MNKRRRDQRRELAKKNQERRETITASAQLAVLDERLGKGIGATRERARLNRLIQETSKASRKRKQKSEAKSR